MKIIVVGMIGSVSEDGEEARFRDSWGNGETGSVWKRDTEMAIVTRKSKFVVERR